MSVSKYLTSGNENVSVIEYCLHKDSSNVKKYKETEFSRLGSVGRKMGDGGGLHVSPVPPTGYGAAYVPDPLGMSLVTPSSLHIFSK